jgi:transposase
MQKEKRMHYAHFLRDQGYRQKDIAERLGVTERTVRNYLKAEPATRKKRKPKSKLDPFKPFVKSIIKEDPYFNCILLFEKILKAGYTGKISILRDYVAKIRKKVLTEAVIRFETEPGLQAQVDWKELGKKTVNGKEQKLYVFSMSLGYSRKPFFLFTTSMKQSVLHACHIKAFEYFRGVPKEILYDNMKTAFHMDSHNKFVPNRKLLSFAHHYGFIPKRCRVRRPQTKGKVERGIGYLTRNFLPRIDWSKDLETHDLNEKVLSWLETINEKPLREFNESRNQRFEREKTCLLPLPQIPYECFEIHEALVNRESFFHYQENRYSVPPRFIGKRITLKVFPLENKAKLLDGDKPIREIFLQEPGAGKKSWFPGDRELVQKMWEKQRKRKPYPRKKLSANKYIPEVIVRKPGEYDELYKEAL